MGFWWSCDRVGVDVVLALHPDLDPRGVQKNLGKYLKSVNESWRCRNSVTTPQTPRQQWVLKEPELWQLLGSTRSNNPAAQRFQHWLYSEVLPEIHRTGTYGGMRGRVGDRGDAVEQQVQAPVQQAR